MIYKNMRFLLGVLVAGALVVTDAGAVCNENNIPPSCRPCFGVNSLELEAFTRSCIEVDDSTWVAGSLTTANLCLCVDGTAVARRDGSVIVNATGDECRDAAAFGCSAP